MRQLFKWFPEAIILFIHRNPINVLKSEVNKKNKHDYFLSKDNPLYSLGLVIFVFFEWFFAAIIASYNKVIHKDKFIVISYEHLSFYKTSSVQKICSALEIEYEEDLCEVEKIGSSYSDGKKKEYWYPSKWIVLLYTIVLQPLHGRLNRVSLNNEQTHVK